MYGKMVTKGDACHSPFTYLWNDDELPTNYGFWRAQERSRVVCECARLASLFVNIDYYDYDYCHSIETFAFESGSQTKVQDTPHA